MDEVVNFERRGYVALITLNRPEARNAISPEMLVRLADTWTLVRTTPTFVSLLSPAPVTRLSVPELI
jgi:enoyl-CoA hydratase/carnithine racemase